MIPGLHAAMTILALILSIAGVMHCAYVRGRADGYEAGRNTKP